MNAAARKQWRDQRYAAERRGIEFLLTFEEWWLIWKQSRKYPQRGCGPGQYVMSRINDVGPYAVGNVLIKTNGNNTREARHRIRSGVQFWWSLRRITNAIERSDESKPAPQE